MDDRRAPHRALEDRLAEVVSPAIRASGFELVLVRVSGNGQNVQVMVERSDDRAMDVEDCAAISRILEGPLEHSELLRGSWQLEVSSPGIDRPLVREKDWRRAKGKRVRVELVEPHIGRRRFSGVVMGLEQEQEPEPGQEQKKVRLRLEDASEVALSLASIRSARLVLTPELLAGIEPTSARN